MMHLEHSFASIFVHSGANRGAVLMTPSSGNHESCSFYFSPQAVVIANDLIAQYGGVPCQPTFLERWDFLAGDAGAAGLLLSYNEA